MLNRGDVVIVDFPFSSGTQSKLHPAVVVQSDLENRRISKTIVVMITGNLRRVTEPTHLLLDPGTPHGASSGLHGKSLVACTNIYTIDQVDVSRVIGHLSPIALHDLDLRLKVALALPLHQEYRAKRSNREIEISRSTSEFTLVDGAGQPAGRFSPGQ
jgi:mRNA interferase MazF